MAEHFEIASAQLGKNIHSKVYIIKEDHSQKELIVKIYEDANIIYLKNEKYLLNRLNKIDLPLDEKFFVMYKNMQFNPGMFTIPKEVKGSNLDFLFYDYLSKLSLFDYIAEIGKKLKEIHAKILCYKLLKIIEKLHENIICHNNIEVKNIMFDDDFNLKLIHYSDARIVNENNKSYVNMNTDLFDLGIVLAKMLTRGKFCSINYNKYTKNYQILYITNIKKKRGIIDEDKFWKLMKDLCVIDISKEFLIFFHILITSKKSKDVIDINELLKNEWFNEIINDIPKYQDIFKDYFKNLYQGIMENNEMQYKFDVDVNDFVDKFEKENNNIYFFNYPNINNINNNINNNYENPFKNINYITEIVGEKIKSLKPRKEDFNYLEINFVNKEYMEIAESMINFLEDLRTEIKKNYDETNINVDFYDLDVTSFSILFVMNLKGFNNEGIEILDEKFEKKFEINKTMEIKVEFMEGEKILDKEFGINEQYYLVFNGNQRDKEDFYEQIFTIKNIAKILLLTNN